MQTIPATEANRSFSQMLRAVRAGESISITSRGVPVAILSPVNSQLSAREAAKQRLLSRLAGQQQAPRSGTVPAVTWTRDELYD
jgi:prevent-host-death family protein